jgi:RimJ/RimL family protein N-acetyltransferase
MSEPKRARKEQGSVVWRSMEGPRMQILLETERLVLRCFTPADLDRLYALDNDPEVMRYVNGGTPTPRAAIARDILPTFMRYDERRPGFGFWAALDKASGEWLGWFSFRPSGGAPGQVVLGYRLCRAAWGRGYATQGARALIDRGFGQWGVSRVVAATYEENRASRRVMEKLGMRLVRRFRITPQEIARSDTYHAQSTEVWDGDDVEYAITRGEWLSIKRRESEREARDE